MKVLITGSAGFIGSHLAERWVADADVVGLDNFDPYYPRSRKERNLAGLLERDTFTFVEGDIRDDALLDQLFAEHAFDLVVHIAARGGVRPSIEEPALYFDVNVTGTLNVLEAMRHHGVGRMVFASSSSVYGVNPDVPWREDAAVLQPISPYAATKVANELTCHTYHHLYGQSITCLRFFTVYGPRQRPDMAIHKFTRMLLAGEPIPFYGDGSSRRDYTYIDDILDGVSAAMERDLGFEIVNLGNSQTVSLDELVTTLAETAGVEPVLDRQPVQPGDVPQTCADIGKAVGLLDYAPSTSLAEGVERFVAWYREEHTG